MPRWDLKVVNILYRRPEADQLADDFLAGDIIEIADPPFYEVDPASQTLKPTLQAFLVAGRDEDGALDVRPVSRNSIPKYQQTQTLH